MKKPRRAGDSPIAIDVKQGQSYWWCRCGLSMNQPFCDGSHKDTGFEPVKYDAIADKKVFFCTCKATRKPPLCDGSHND